MASLVIRFGEEVELAHGVQVAPYGDGVILQAEAQLVYLEPASARLLGRELVRAGRRGRDGVGIGLAPGFTVTIIGAPSELRTIGHSLLEWLS